jgi:hypothetical protein
MIYNRDLRAYTCTVNGHGAQAWAFGLGMGTVRKIPLHITEFISALPFVTLQFFFPRVLDGDRLRRFAGLKILLVSLGLGLFL